MIKKKLLKKGQVLKIPIFNNEYSVYVVYGDLTDVKRALKKCGYDEKSIDTLDGYQGFCFSGNNRHPLITLRQKPTTAASIGCLVHEATHSIERIFGYIEQPIGDEIFAHSIEAIVRETLKAIGK
jgi:hypothetical protein